MNFRAIKEEVKAIAERKETEAKRWGKYGLLKGLKGEARLNATVLMENQRRFNETDTTTEGIIAGHDLGQFKRISIPLVRRIASTVLNDLVSVQPAFSDEKKYLYYTWTNPNGQWLRKSENPVEHNFRKLKTKYSWESSASGRSHNNLDAEAELVAILAEEMRMEYERNVLEQIMEHCATTTTYDFSAGMGDTIKEKVESLFVALTDLCQKVFMLTGRLPNWLVTSPEISSFFEVSTSRSFSNDNPFGVNYVGKFWNWKLYKDALFPTGKIVLGYKDPEDLYSGGYAWYPRVLCKPSPFVLDPDDFVPYKGFMSEADGCFVEDGERYYAVMNLEDYTV